MSVSERAATDRRYEMDVAQAVAMRSGKSRTASESNRPPTAVVANELTEKDVLMALKGLEESDALRQSGDLQQAFDISSLSLEILIKLLRLPSSAVPTVDRGTVGARVQVALSDAESLKEKIRSAKEVNPVSPPTGQRPTTRKQSAIQSLFKSLESAVSRNTGTRSNSPQKGQGSKPIASSRPAQTPGQSTSSRIATSRPVLNQGSRNHSNRSLNESAHRQPSYRISPRGQTSVTPKASPANQEQTASPFRSNDPLVGVIKSDFYVPQARLQSTSWNDIAGLENAKQSMQEAAILPMMRPDLFTGLRKPQNILLYGPPGTGKTLLVRAVAKESNCLLFVCSASAVTSKWQGEGEKLVRTLFDVARAAAPSIVFIDEMDALLSARKSEGEHEASRRLKTEFMTNMDGIVKGSGDVAGVDGEPKHTLVIGCTNCPWDVDSAVLRRFPKRIYIPLPDPETRKALLLKLLEKAGKYKISSAEFKNLIKRTQGFSGSDIASIAAEASFGPLRSLGGLEAIRNADAHSIRPISAKDFDGAISQATKSVSSDLLKKYDEWKRQQAAN